MKIKIASFAKGFVFAALVALVVAATTNITQTNLKDLPAGANPGGTNTVIGLSNGLARLYTLNQISNVFASAFGSGGGAQNWTNDGTGFHPTGTLTSVIWIRPSDGSVFVNTNVLMKPGINIDPVNSSAHYFSALFATNASGSTIWESQIGTLVNGGNQEYSRVRSTGSYNPATTNYESEFTVTGNGPDENTLAALVAHNEPGVYYSRLVLNPGGGGKVITLGAENGGSYIKLGSVFAVGDGGAITGATYTVSGTTNQVIFGSTNTPPVSAVVPTKWISVQVSGESAVYRLPLYE